ncbi:MAG: ketoacyl-ACP synthase III [Verrucomicrobia bacterium]|nr:ketoacyl-ACP synthase III [Verrucomicrobiota bacterium]
MREAYIAGTGMYAPDKVLTNADLEKIVDTTDEWITSRTGIKERHIAADGTGSSDMALPAARDALAAAGLTPGDLDLIIVSTFTPDSPCPSAACLLQEKLGARNAASFDLNAACSGFIYGLTTARQFVISGMYERVLVVGVDKLSSVTNWKDRNTCVLFGDAAGAAVVTREPKRLKLRGGYLGADGSMATLLHVPGGGSVAPATHETVDQDLHYIMMKGREVFKAAVLSMERAVDRLLDQEGVEKREIRWLIPHQANMRIIKVLGDYLELSPEKVHKNIESYGNTSAATTAIGLHLVVDAGEFDSSDKIVLVAFGGGFTWGACLIECL